jgi:hypothetical protein
MKPFFKIFLFSTFIAATAAHSQTIISDSFESGDLSARYTSGIDWAGTNRTSLVKRDPVRGDIIIYSGNREVEILSGFDKQWKAKHGDVSMRFDYPSGTNSWAEQRFSLSSAHPEIWIRFWLKVPINFRHSSNSPSNSKLFALWMDGYSSKGAGPTIIWEFWNDGSGGSRLAYHYSPGGFRTANSHKQHKQFIRYPNDQGRWMQVVMQVEMARTTSSNDGVIRLYRRWDNETSFTMLHEDTNADIGPPSGGPKGWKAGYLMGWSNPGYSQRTEWLLDDLKFSNTSLLDVVDAPSPEPEPEPTPEPEPGIECKAPRVPHIMK